MPSCMFHYIVSSWALQPFGIFEIKLFYSILTKCSVLGCLISVFFFLIAINGIKYETELQKKELTGKFQPFPYVRLF